MTRLRAGHTRLRALPLAAYDLGAEGMDVTARPDGFIPAPFDLHDPTVVITDVRP